MEFGDWLKIGDLAQLMATFDREHCYESWSIKSGETIFPDRPTCSNGLVLFWRLQETMGFLRAFPSFPADFPFIHLASNFHALRIGIKPPKDMISTISCPWNILLGVLKVFLKVSILRWAFVQPQKIAVCRLPNRMVYDRFIIVVNFNLPGFNHFFCDIYFIPVPNVITGQRFSYDFTFFAGLNHTRGIPIFCGLTKLLLHTLLWPAGMGSLSKADTQKRLRKLCGQMPVGRWCSSHSQVAAIFQTTSLNFWCATSPHTWESCAWTLDSLV